jgi:hypothetical protein
MKKIKEFLMFSCERHWKDKNCNKREAKGSDSLTVG